MNIYALFTKVVPTNYIRKLVKINRKKNLSGRRVYRFPYLFSAVAVLLQRDQITLTFNYPAIPFR